MGAFQASSQNKKRKKNYSFFVHFLLRGGAGKKNAKKMPRAFSTQAKSVWLCRCVSMSLCPWVSGSLCLCVSMSLCLCVCVSLFFVSVCLCLCLCVYVFVCVCARAMCVVCVCAMCVALCVCVYVVCMLRMSLGGMPYKGCPL